MTRRLRGAIAASVTPMRDGGRTVDIPAVAGLTAFLADGGVDGVLAGGTTGEGILLDVGERRALAEAFVAAAPPGFDVAVHAGAQSTRDTVALAGHAREVGADAVAVIAPPYFPLDDDALAAHLVAAANAADPLPFYIYEFAARSGYAIDTAVARTVRDAAANVIGMKVSDSPFDVVKPYLELGLDVFIGSEPLVLEGIEAGAVGSVSGLAAAFPEVTAALVHDRSPEAHEQACRLRDGLSGVPFHAAVKHVLVERGVLVSPDVRPPLRMLSGAERATVSGLATSLARG